MMKINRNDKTILSFDDEFVLLEYKTTTDRDMYNRWTTEGFRVNQPGEGDETSVDAELFIPLGDDTLGAFEIFLIGEGMELIDEE
jgi:hypothetical protein